MTHKFGFILLACILLFTAACSSSPKRRSLGETLDDAVISNKLKAKYLSDKIINGFDINVDTWKGVVSLRGKADSQTQINRAIELAELQQGVQEVRSYLVLRQQEEDGLVKPKESFFQRKTPRRGEIEEKTIGQGREPAPVRQQAVSKPKKDPKPSASVKPSDKGSDMQPLKEEPAAATAPNRELIFKDSKKEEPAARKSASTKDSTHDAILNEKPPRITDD